MSAVLGGGGSKGQSATLLAQLSAGQEVLERRARVQDAAIEAATRRIAAVQAHQDEVLGTSGVSVADLLRRLTEQEIATQRAQAALASQARR